MYRVMVCTDEPILEAGLRTVLGSESGFEILTGGANFPDVLRALANQQPDILLYGINPDLLSLSEIRAAAPRTEIVLWGSDFSPEFAHSALEIGVRGFASSTCGPETLKECLRISGGGGTWMERSLSVSMLHARPPRLSPRQTELIQLLAQGLKNKEIAEKLGIAEGTVKSYLTVIFEKVGVKDRFELALYWMKHHGSLGELIPKPSRPQLGSRIARRPVA
jgi:DNA-binding NarL/FixJ family response regulator